MGSVAKGESSRCGGSGAKKRIFSGRCSTRGRDAGLDAATFNPGRWPVHGCKVGAVGKMPDARRFSAAVGNKGAREIVAVEKCAVSQSLGRLPVPMSNVRGLGSVFDAGRPWELDKRGTRTSRNIYLFPRQFWWWMREAYRTTVGSSITSSKSAGLTRISVIVVRCTRRSFGRYSSKRARLIDAQ